jgi:hypothetical protein
MKKIIVLYLAAAFILSALPVSAEERTDNPGYFVTPGFISLSGARSSIPKSSDTSSDKDVRPVLIGMFNVIQSEYGNLGLSLGGFYTSPSAKFSDPAYNYRITADQYTGEVGLNYYTASKTINFWVGAGYNFSYIEGETKSFRNSAGAPASYSQKYYSTVEGFHFYLGFEYVITRNGRWGLLVLVRGLYPKPSYYDKEGSVTFSDGTTELLSGRDKVTHSVQSYSLGLIYHF